jgi:density-regulated protein DRP1
MAEELLQPVKIVYCGKCGMPPEYCDYGPDFESHCDPWLSKNHPVLRSKLAASRTHKPKSSAPAAEEEDVGPARPSDPWTTEDRLMAFYSKYQSDKLDSVPGMVEKYAGKEDKLFVALVKKYGPEPEDPYYAADSDEDEDDESLEEGMDNLNVAGGKKRRGVAAKKAAAVETKVIIQKLKRNKKKATTVVIGMETVADLKLKDAAKAFSKRFAGSSTVKDGLKGKEIIIQGDHMESVAAFVVDKFKVPGGAIFLDMDGEFMPYK